MYEHAALVDLSKNLIANSDRYAAHEKAQPIVEQLCQDRDFLHEALRGCLADPAFLQNADYLTFPMLLSGDVIIQLNLFAPIRDGGKDITQDNIHHHGWRLLTTGVVSGDGYNSIDFKQRCHENRTGDKVNLEAKEIFRHVSGKTRFIESYTPHVVFHPTTLCSTLAVWSADHLLASQGIKRHLAAFPALRKTAVKLIHAARLNHVFGLNPLKGLYYHPEDGRFVETPDYSKPFDGDREEILGCMFKFFQQVGLDDADYWRGLAKEAPPEALPLIDQLISHQPIADLGIWGNLRRRFSKTQILQTLDPSVPADVQPAPNESLRES
jgi:hypothetical protein